MLTEDHTITGWGALPEQLFQQISSSANSSSDEYFKGVEVGSAYGRSAVYLAKLFKEAGRSDALIYCVDIWKSDRQFCEFLGNIHSYDVADIIVPVRAPSNMAVNAFVDESISFLYIDGDHKYNSVKSDILFWLPKLQTKSLMAIHDIHLNPVRKAVGDVIGIENGYIDGITWIYKKS